MKTYKVGENILSVDLINEIISKDLKLSISSIAESDLLINWPIIYISINNSL